MKKSNNIVVGIPARMGSTRFPGKPLCKILGMPMIEHVYRRCLLAESIADVFVAACDDVVRDAVIGFGGKVIMTPLEIARPALRVANACDQLDMDDNDIVVVVQGDEPLFNPKMIDLAVEPLMLDQNLKLGTLVAEASDEEWLDLNEVKVVVNKHDEILFMTRSPTPSNTRNRVGPRLKQVAIMPFRKKFLAEFDTLPSMPYELAESIELLRAIEHGIRVKAIRSPFKNISVDTERDRLESEAAMRDDPIYRIYSGKNYDV